MALESVLAIAPPSIGAGNKDTQNAGDYQSDENAQDDSFSAGDPADLEEGEILDSEGEAQENGEHEGGQFVIESMVVEPTFEEFDPEMDQPGKIGKKKRKKKKKKEDEAENNAEDGKPVKKKVKYIDHDRVQDDDMWFPGSPTNYRRTGMLDYRRNYDSPYNSPQGSSHRDQKRSESPLSSQSLDENVNEFDNGPNGRRPNRQQRPVKRRVLGRKQVVERGSLKKKRMVRTSGMGLADAKKKRRLLRMKGREPRRRPACKFYLEGKCLKGNDCPFAHNTSPPKKKDLCKFFLNGYCAKGEKCLYMHNDFPCKFFHTGAECYSESKCRFSHDPLTEEMKKILNRFLERNELEEEQIAMEMMRQREESSPPRQKRPSLLGSPPRHVKEAAETWEWQQEVLRMQRNNKRSPREGRGQQRVPFIRPNFYVDTMSHSPVKQQPAGYNCDREQPPPEFRGGQKFDFYDCPSDSPPRDCQTPIPTDEDEGNLSDNEKRDTDFDSALWEEARSVAQSAESPPQEATAPTTPEIIATVPPAEIKSEPALSPPPLPMLEPQPPTSPSVIPFHLPKRQRELFLRIQQHQKEVSATSGESSEEQDGNKSEDASASPEESSAAEPIASEKEVPKEIKEERPVEVDLKEEEEDYDEEKEEVKEKWYSSDEDDDTEDQPLAEVLKKLQQMPPPPARSQQLPASPVPSAPCQPIDISKMLNSIRQQASQPSVLSMKSEFWQNILATAAVPPALPKPSEPLVRPQTVASRDPRCRDAKPALLSTPGEPQVVPNRDPRTKFIPSNRDPRNLGRISAPDVKPTLPLPVIMELPITSEEKFWEVRVPSRTPNGKATCTSLRLHTVAVVPRDYTPYVHATQNDLKLMGDPRLKKLLAQCPVPKTPILPFPPELQHSLEKLKEPEVTKPALELPKVPQTPVPIVRKTDPRLARGTTQPANSLPQEPPQVPAALLNPAPLLPRFPPRSAIDPRLARLHHPPDALRVPQKRPPKPKPQLDKSEKPTFKQPLLPHPPPLPIKKDEPVVSEKDESTKIKGGSINRKSSLDYASPLNSYDESYEGSGYSSYNRRPQQRPPPANPIPDAINTLTTTSTTTTNTTSTTTTMCVIPTSVPGASQGNIPSPISKQILSSSEAASSSPQEQVPGFHPNSPNADLVNHASLKDVFKTIDPTASPFC